MSLARSVKDPEEGGTGSEEARFRCTEAHRSRQFIMRRRKDARMQKPNPPRAPQVRKSDECLQLQDDGVVPGKHPGVQIGNFGEVETRKRRENHSPVPRPVRQQMTSRETLPCKSVQIPPPTGN